MDYVYCEGGSNGVPDDILTLTSISADIYILIFKFDVS